MGILASEDAVIAQVKALLGNKVKAVDSLPGDFDEDTLKRMLILTPGVFVLWTGGGAKAVGGASPSLDGQWVLYIVTAHASGQAARRRGDAQQAGAYELIEVLLPGLHGFNLADDGSLTFVRVENLFNGRVDKRGVAVYAITFQQMMTLPAVPDPSLLTPFETFDAQWDVPPHSSASEHEDWLEGDYLDSVPDARDTVALPQP